MATSSFAGTLTLFNVTDQGSPASMGAAVTAVGQDPFSQLQNAPAAGAHPAMGMQKAPKWLKRPCGAVFGYGGRLARFDATHPGLVKACVYVFLAHKI